MLNIHVVDRSCVLYVDVAAAMALRCRSRSNLEDIAYEHEGIAELFHVPHLRQHGDVLDLDAQPDPEHVPLQRLVIELVALLLAQGRPIDMHLDLLDERLHPDPILDGSLQDLHVGGAYRRSHELMIDRPQLDAGLEYRSFPQVAFEIG